MLTVGDRFPRFNLTSVVSLEPGSAFAELSSESFPGKWLVVFFWPMDFTFVCPTEIADFGRHHAQIRELGGELLGGSIDTQYVHLAWRKDHPDLKQLPFPMLADTRRELSSALGILHADGVALRATFIVDPEGIIRFASVNDLSVGRSASEVVRTLEGLQTGELCPANWQRGDKFLRPA